MSSRPDAKVISLSFVVPDEDLARAEATLDLALQDAEKLGAVIVERSTEPAEKMIPPVISVMPIQ